MKHFDKKELFSIPNLMCYFRIILIPVYCYMYITAETPKDYLWATVIVLISALTDLFDGQIARRFNMVTEFGKVLDPVADKINHAAMAVCVATKYPFMWALLALMVVKEGYMAYQGMRFLGKNKMMDGAMWFGKVCTATLFVGLVLLFFWFNMPVGVANGIILIMMCVMVFTFVKYVMYYQNMKQELND